MSKVYTIENEKVTMPEKKKELSNHTRLFQFRTHFKSYCNHTSIHCFQYFGQNRTILEKCWWIIVFMCIMSCCSFAIYLIYMKWQRSPVIVSLTTRDTPIYQVPFPAVTICPTIKYSNKDIKFGDLVNLTMFKHHKSGNTTKQESPTRSNLFEYMFSLCSNEELAIYFFNGFSEKHFSEDIYRTLIQCSPFANESMSSALFMGERLSFHRAFRPLLTEEGLCFTFNMLSTADVFTDKAYLDPRYRSTGPKSFWIPQVGYSNKAALLTYPRRALLSGAANSLDIKLFSRKKDIDFMCTGAEQGYKIILHFPGRVPRPGLEYALAPFGKSTSLSINPNMMTTSDVVRMYDPDKRDCYFQGEKDLHFFKIYSKLNCQTECLTNYTLAECGCVPFYMPRDRSTPICGVSNLFCVKFARKKFNLSKLKSKLKELKEIDTRRFSVPLEELQFPVSNTTNTTSPSNSTKKIRSVHFNNFVEELGEDETARCKCLRGCNDITYYQTATTVDYNWKQESLFLSSFFNSTKYDITHISLFFNSDVIFTTERNELYGPTDFLSNFGGLLGLFTGFSILSFMEILYFCTFRILGNRKLLGRWYGDKDD